MNLKTLWKFLTGEIIADCLRAEIDAEVRNYARSLQFGQTSAEIVLTHESTMPVFGISELRRLCEAFLEGRLPLCHFEYVCDAIDLAATEESVKLESEQVERLLWEIVGIESNESRGQREDKRRHAVEQMLAELRGT